MEILSTDRSSSLGITLMRIEHEHYPAMSWSIAVVDGDFRGANPHVGIAMEDFDRFLVELRECERTRKGSAKLVDMSLGEECEVTIAQTEAWGHFSLKYKVGRTTYDSCESRFRSVSGQFELDSEYFARLVSAFEELPNVSPEEKD